MKTLEDLRNSQSNLVIMHYATTDFSIKPIKVTSISVKNYATGHTESFSVNENAIEEKILKDFLSYMKKFKNYTIVTWNQKSAQYGPQQLRERCKELGVAKSLSFDINDVVDLDEIFSKEFGHHYSDNPKLLKLAELNNITLDGFVAGKQEIELFDNKEYQKLENSVIRKVSVIYRFLRLALENNLKTKLGKGKTKLGKGKTKARLNENTRFYIMAIIIIASSIVSPTLGYYIPLVLDSEKEKNNVEYANVDNSTSELLTKLFESKMNDFDFRVTELETHLSTLTEENEIMKLEQIIDRLKIANNYMKEQNYVDAEKYYGLVLKGDLNNPDALDGIALALARQDKFEESMSYYEKLLIIKPNYYVALINNAWSLAQLEKYEDSLKILNELENDNSDDLLVLSHKCWIVHKLDFHEDAISVCEKVLSHGTNDDRVAMAYALSLILLNRYEDALPFYEKLYQLYPTNFPTIINYGNLLMNLERAEEALNIYNDGLEKFPNHKVLQHNKNILCTKNPHLSC